MKPVLLFLALAACASAGADPAASASEVRNVDPFHGIAIVGTVEVDARIDAATRLEVFAEPASQLGQIVTSVKDGILVIETKGKLPKRKLRAVISAPSLDSLAVPGTGVLRVKGLTGGALNVTVPGTGQVVLAGKVQSLNLDVGGTGEVRAKDLVARTVRVDVGGTAEATVHATDSVDATISGTGAIRVHGRPPSVRKSVSGTGIVDVH